MGRTEKGEQGDVEWRSGDVEMWRTFLTSLTFLTPSQQVNTSQEVKSQKSDFLTFDL